MRRVIIFGLALLLAGGRAPFASANELTEWMLAQRTDDFAADDRDDDAADADEFVDPGADMRLRMSGVADRGLDDDAEAALTPCGMDRSAQRRFFCWTSYGRKLHIVLPAVAANFVGVLRPRTLYSYKSLDFRFPPSLRLRLPFNAISTLGYEGQDELLGWRLQMRF